MSYNLFLDDIRVPEMVYKNPDNFDFVVVRTYEKFISYIQENGLPNYISFDNDLGLNAKGELAEDGYAAAKWLVYHSGIDLRNLEFYVHSANPVAAKQIEGLLTNYINHLKYTSR
ncbi:cyclic-phosphate processing receiver domain-containing protein [Kordia zhangzhouensis]|uniref:cyclic-phosphate processing receiver domain-containing protein n=1 Tax=Kordia zhangzhouensis TaxID=1620405 RepID=UPI0006296C10|nr:cyclic-phosphate processing receiver domain-containing protein [Kordia zhangzhouensis]